MSDRGAGPSPTATSDGSPTANWQRRLSESTGSRYELLDELGRGGMATVFRAHDRRLDRIVAIKILHHHLVDDSEHVARFRREAEAIARLEHPGIISIFDLLEEPDQFLAIVMEYVAGPSLDELLESAPPLVPELAAAVTIPLIEALAHAHDQGIIHRDLKPSNILVDDEYVVRLTDFGIADVADDTALTHTGSVLGSPHFMSPEMAQGQPVDVGSDLFSLGSILYLMVTGNRPFSAGSTPAVLRNIAEGRCKRADYVREQVGRNFASILEKFLAENPEERPSDARRAGTLLGEFVDQTLDTRPTLEKWLNNPESYPSEVQAKVADSLHRRARKAVEDDDRRRALPLLERLICVAPDDTDAEQLLDDLHDSDTGNIRKIIVGAVSAVTAMGVAVFLSTNLGGDEPVEHQQDSIWHTQLSKLDDHRFDESEDDDRSTVKSTHRQLGADAAEAAETTAEDIAASKEVAVFDDESAAGDPPDQRPSDKPLDSDPVTEPQPVSDREHDPLEISDEGDDPAPIRFQLVPASATLEVDGRRFDAVEAARGIHLTEGTHEFVASAPATESHRETITVGPDGDDEHAVVLSWKDGYVRVHVNRDALLWIDDEQSPRRISTGADEAFAIPFGRADRVDSQRQVRLRVADRDDLETVREKTVRVRPETETTVAVTFHED